MMKKMISVLIIATLLLMASGCVQPDETIDEEQVETAVENQTELSTQKEYTISQVNAAVDLIEEEGEIAFPEFRQKDSQWFHDDSYIFVWKTDGIRVVYPPDVDGENKDMSLLEDFNAKPIGRMFIDIALSEEGEGWIDYHWPKPGETNPSMKYTFIKSVSIEDQTYLVGSGFYVDDYIYTQNLEDVEHFTRFGNVFIGNFLHPANVEKDLDVDYSIAHVIVKPGQSIEPHMMKNPEVHYILEGEGVLYIEDVPFELIEGQLVHIPANSKQYTQNTGDADLEFFAINQPAWAEENEEIVE